MSVYPVPPCAASLTADGGEVPGGGVLMVAVRLADVVPPLRNGRPLAAGDRSALVIGGTEKIRTGDAVVFLKAVAVAPARVRRDGRVHAQGSPVHHATLGPLEDWLEEQAGPGVIDGIAERAVLREEYVKGERERLLARAFMIRVIVLLALVPDADAREAVTALAGDLALVPWARAWVPASARAAGDWRNALGPGPLEELRDIVLRASWQEHEDRDWRAVIIGRNRPLKVSSLDGTLVRVPDTPANRAAFGSVGTGDDSSPFPQLRALPLTDASTRSLLGMPHGPAGTDKAAAEQKLLDTAMEQYPHLFTMDRIWLMDRNYHGAPRIARLIARTHVLIRLKSDIPLKRTSEILADGSYLAEISGDGVTVTVRVIEYWVTVEGQEVPEMFCLVTDLMDCREYPAAELAALYKWRWDGSETALREAKASLDGAGPSAGPMLRSGSPGLVRQELAAWAAGNEMTRGVARAAALAAVPAKKGRRAGMPVQAREISH
ncbi:MAG TPA: transposase, partial [Streptosporangiaceae bacterium]|nr:transposase [Streptosporangiaceae bacterium]